MPCLERFDFFAAIQFGLFTLRHGQSVTEYLDEAVHILTHLGSTNLDFYFCFAGQVYSSRAVMLISVSCLCIK